MIRAGGEGEALVAAPLLPNLLLALPTILPQLPPIFPELAAGSDRLLSAQAEKFVTERTFLG